MNKSKEQRETLKATLKMLRAERGASVDAATERNKRRQATRKRVRVGPGPGPRQSLFWAAAHGSSYRGRALARAAMRK